MLVKEYDANGTNKIEYYQCDVKRCGSLSVRGHGTLDGWVHVVAYGGMGDGERTVDTLLCPSCAKFSQIHKMKDGKK